MGRARGLTGTARAGPPASMLRITAAGLDGGPDITSDQQTSMRIPHRWVSLMHGLLLPNLNDNCTLKASPDWGISGLASKSKSKSKSNPKGAFALIDAGAAAGVHLSHLCRENRESTPHLRPRPLPRRRGSVSTPAQSGLRAAATYTIHDTALTAYSMLDARPRPQPLSRLSSSGWAKLA